MSASTTSVGWLLRHPSDHYFTKALEVVRDSRLADVLKEWVTVLDTSYQALATYDLSIERSNASLLAEVRVAKPSVTNWDEPVAAEVLNSDEGSAPPGSTLALRQVAEPDATFNGTLFSMLSGEHWLVHGDRLNDGSVVIRDGTRRIRTAHR